MPDGFKIHNRWGTFQDCAQPDDVFADPGSVVDAQAIHFEFSKYSSGEVLLTLHPISRGQPRVLRSSKSQTSSEESAVESRFGFRRLVETFFDPVHKHKVELWELRDGSWAVRQHDLSNGSATTFFELDTGAFHRPF